MTIDWTHRRSAARGWAQQTLIFIFFAVLLGTYGSRAFAPYLNREFQPAWERARWITQALPGVKGYFRREINMPALPKKAILQIASTDTFTLYVNGKEMGGSTMVSARPSALFDITSQLKEGRNIIAICVERKTYPGQAELIVEGYSRMAGGVQLPIFSDASWHSAILEESQAQGAILWYSPDFIDSAWAYAREMTGSIPNAVYPMSAPPEMLNDFPRGLWIWSGNQSALRGTFRREFNISSSHIESGWLGISSVGAYVVSVNGIEAYSSRPTAQYMDMMNIAPYLRPGRNQVILDAATAQPPGQVAVGLLVKTASGSIDVSSDGEWQSAEYANASGDPTNWAAPSVLGPMLGVGAGAIRNLQASPTLRIVSSDDMLGQFRAQSLRALPWAFAVLATTMLMAWAFGQAARSAAPVTWLQTTTLFAKPLIVIAAVLAFAMLLTYDVRLDSAQIFQSWSFALAVAVPLLWEIVILLELRRWGSSQGTPNA
jgi:hypothetical protein